MKAKRNLMDGGISIYLSIEEFYDLESATIRDTIYYVSKKIGDRLIEERGKEIVDGIDLERIRLAIEGAAIEKFKAMITIKVEGNQKG